MSQRRGTTYCSVYGCMNSYANKSNISYFKHPTDVERRTKWLQLIGREELIDKLPKNYCVCEDHFNVDDVLPGKKRKTLKRNALPVHKLPFLQQQSTQEVLITSVKIETEERAEDPLETTESLEILSPEVINTIKCEDLCPETTESSEILPPEVINTIKCEDLSQETTESSENLRPGSIKSLIKFEEDLFPETTESSEDLPPVAIETTESAEDLPPETIETTESRQFSADQTRKRKLVLPLPECSKKLKEHETENQNKVVFLGPETFHILCDKFLSKELADLVKAHDYLKQKLPGTKYYDRDKFCLNLYHTSPHAYRILQNALCLPCSSNLNKIAIPITTEINGKMMSMLKIKVKNMTDVDKNCSAVISAISLKASMFYNIKEDKIIGFHDINNVKTTAPAETAYIMMVRGIFNNWKQPVGYALLSGCDNSIEFNEWIDELLEKLFNIGLNVRTFVSDTRNDFIMVAKNRSVTIKKPYFFINNRKIYYIYDAPHLIKLVRSYFIGYDYLYQDRRAKYEHILQFYDKDKNKKFRLAPKLTNSHVRPTNFDKMKLHYATQLLSNSVATGISTYVDFYVIDQSGRHTADFIKLMNNLFDSLNSFDSKENDEYKGAFRGTDSQIEFFDGLLIYFQNLKLLTGGRDITSQVKFIEGFQTTITSILQLSKDIKLEGHSFLLTRWLNLEVIDHFIDQMKTKYGMVSELTAWQFISAFRNSFLCNIIKCQKRESSVNDLSNILIETNKLKQGVSFKKTKKMISDPNDEAESDIKIMTSDYKRFELPNKHCLFEVCIYLLKKCAENHKKCKLLKSYIKPYKNIPNFSEESRYQHYRKYSQDQCKSLITVPCDNFVRYVKKLDASFVGCFRTQQTYNKVMALIVTKIRNNTNFTPPCPCFPQEYLIKLFVRMRIYNVIKFNNRTLGIPPGSSLGMFVNPL